MLQVTCRGVLTIPEEPYRQLYERRTGSPRETDVLIGIEPDQRPIAETPLVHSDSDGAQN